jgi:hypothetical protein
MRSAAWGVRPEFSRVENVPVGLKLARVTAVTPLSPEQTYAIETEFQTFVADGVVVHNTNFASSGRQLITTADGAKKSLAHYDHAEVVYRSLVRRIKSRFLKAGGDLPGMVVMVSSANTIGSFIDRRVLETKGDPSVFIRDYATWDVKPVGSFTGKKFRVLCGTSSLRSRILEDDEQVSLEDQPEGTRVVNIPDEYRIDFESDLENSLRDIAGVPTTAISLFIQRPEKIELCINDAKHPFSSQVWRFGDSYQWLWQHLVRPIKRRLPGGFEEDAWVPLRNPGKMRYIHIDPALSGDNLGFAMGHVERWVEVVRRTPEGERFTDMAPYFVIDFMLKVKPPKGEQIYFPDVRALVYDLMKHGFSLIGFSCDQYQCLSGDTRVPTTRGALPLRDVQVGDTVVSRSGPRSVTNKWAFGVRPTLRLVTEDGDVIEGTDRHRLEVFLGYAGTGRRGGKIGPVPYRTWGGVRLEPVYEWRRLGDIKVGDIVRMWTDEIVDAPSVSLVAVENGYRDDHGVLGRWVSPSVMTVELAEFLGVSWANGHWTEDGIRITSDVRDIEDVERITQLCFSDRVLGRTRGDEAQGVLSVSSRWFMRWLQQNGVDKRRAPGCIPEVIWRSSRAVRGAFLRGLFSGDGSVGSTGGCSFSTKWQTLAQDVQRMLRCTWGLASCLVTITRGHPGDYVQEGEQYVVAVRGSRQRFLNAVGFGYTRKQEMLRANAHRPGRELLVKIDRVEVSETEVFDLEVDGDPSYVANGFVSHNSAEMLQQMRKRGVAAQLLSVDASPDPYLALRSAIYERRIDFYRHEDFLFELKALEHDHELNKVDHALSGSKDLADSVAGVVAGLGEKVSRIPMGVVRETEGDGMDSDMRWVTDKKMPDVEDQGPAALPFIIGD